MNRTKVNGKTAVLGLIGNPVEHTLSPIIHNTISQLMVDENGIWPASYVPFLVNSEGIESAVKGAYELNIRGMNVTVPHKMAVMPYLKEIDPQAKAIGAVNTLVRVDGGYKGYNTDAEGFGRELDFYGIEVEDETVVMLGAGGASNAVAFSLAQKGAKRIYIFNRTKEKAINIAIRVNEFVGKNIVEVKTYDEINSLQEDSYIAVQCTNVGLHPDVDNCVIEDGSFFDKVSAGVDIIYKPTETKFMKLIRKRGARAYNGLRMLLYQGIAAYEKFMKATVPAQVCEIAARQLEKAAGINRPLIFIGYMGCGKTTISRQLSNWMGVPVMDTDEMIVKEQGKSINDIFADQGEEAFRDMETELIERLLGQNQGMYILSVGGGLPLREKNMNILKTLGTVVYLKAEPEVIYNRVCNDTSRPLLKGEDLMSKINNMLKLRGPLYERCAGITIEVGNKSINHVAREIKRLL